MRLSVTPRKHSFLYSQFIGSRAGAGLAPRTVRLLPPRAQPQAPLAPAAVSELVQHLRSVSNLLCTPSAPPPLPSNDGNYDALPNVLRMSDDDECLSFDLLTSDERAALRRTLSALLEAAVGPQATLLSEPAVTQREVLRAAIPLLQPADDLQVAT